MKRRDDTIDKPAAKSIPTPSKNRDSVFYTKRHIKFGWWSSLFFLTFGILLELFHGFKMGWYLNVSNETRRFMFTLAHAHGVLLGLANVVLGICFTSIPQLTGKRRALASNCLLGATILMPAGFLLGGMIVYGGDPGFGITLVPIGAVLLFIAIFNVARSCD